MAPAQMCAEAEAVVAADREPCCSVPDAASCGGGCLCDSHCSDAKESMTGELALHGVHLLIRINEFPSLAKDTVCQHRNGHRRRNAHLVSKLQANSLSWLESEVQGGQVGPLLPALGSLKCLLHLPRLPRAPEITYVI